MKPHIGPAAYRLLRPPGVRRVKVETAPIGQGSAIASAEMKTEDDRNDSYRSAGAFTGSGDLGRGPGDSAGFGMNAKVNAQKELSPGNN